MQYSWITTFKKFVCFCCCTFISFSIQAQSNARIAGTAATQYLGKTAYLIKEADPVSGLKSIIGESQVDSLGVFSFDLEVQETAVYTINIFNVNATLLLEPGQNYEVFFPYLEEDQVWNISNTLKVDLIFEDPDTLGINYLVSSYNGHYYRFYNDNAQLLNSKRAMMGKVRDFIDTTQALYSDIENPYFQNFVKYSNAELKLVNGFNKRQLFDSLLVNTDLMPENTGWRGFTNTFFADYFQTYDMRFGGDLFAKKFNAAQNFLEVDSLLLKDDYLQNDELRHYVLLLALKENTYNPDFSFPKILEVTKHLSASSNKTIADIASNMLQMFTGFATGMPLPEVELLTKDSNEIFLRDVLGDRPVYIIITSNWCVSCTNEKVVLGSLQEEYKDHFGAIELIIESDFDYFSNRGVTVPNVPAYLVKNSYMFKDNFRVRSLPAYVLTDEDGNLKESYPPAPSDGLEKLLYKWKVQQQESNTIKVGQ